MKTLSLVITAYMLMISVVGCGGGSGRSIEAYCTTMAEHRDSYLASMGNTEDLTGLLNAVGAIGDLKNMWKELAEVAPEEIRQDTEAVRDAWIKIEDAAVSGDNRTLFGQSLFNSAALERVDAYMIEHCGAYTRASHDGEKRIVFTAPGLVAWADRLPVSLAGIEQGTAGGTR